ncbi:helix-turn-helix domain-containing protein [Jatrophihabitans sp. YIM 134969]
MGVMATERPPLLRDVLGEQLRRLRHEQGRTLADVAATAALSLAYLSEVERGRKEISSEVLAALCEALGISLADLLAMVRDAMKPVAPDRAVIRVAATRRHTAAGRVDGDVLPMGLSRSRLTGGHAPSPEMRAA